ncbi:MAG TPA: hypothetical protein VJR89_41735, partial [Polyangiales bacterium]|nr:hypothetical protein [Polyangiales bacterium]
MFSARREHFDNAAGLTLAAAVAAAFATFRDYGVPWDAQGEAEYGRLLIRYYSSWFRDQAAFEFINFRFYGGGVELPAALLARISPFDLYETRHLFTALIGVVGLAVSGTLARRLGGARAGFIPVGLLLLNPLWYGNAFINARDVPFATGMTGCLLLTLRVFDELPRIRWRTAVAFGAALGWTVSVRVGGVLALVYLLAALALWFVLHSRPRSMLLRSGAALALALCTAYAVMAVLWPWSVQAPRNPWRALQMFSRFPLHAPVLFDGELIPASALPARYLPVQFAIRAPETLWLGLGAALLWAAASLRSWRRPGWLRERAPLLLVVLAALFPFAYFAALRPVAYNGMRHFLFVLPPLSVLAALAIDRTLELRWRAARIACAAALLLACLAPARMMVALHPDQYVYFNAWVGGPRGAHGRYELDYWGTSLGDAAGLLADHLEDRGLAPR